jgi:RNA polymerase sigma factor (TIGR02999 family)
MSPVNRGLIGAPFPRKILALGSTPLRRLKNAKNLVDNGQMTRFGLSSRRCAMGEPDSARLNGTVTRLIAEIGTGDPVAQAKLCDLVYKELRAIGQRMRRRAGCSLDTTDVVNDFLSRILADGRLGQMKNRRYFYAAAASQMRRLIIDHWRKRKTQLDGGRLKREDLEPWLDELTESAASRCGDDMEALEKALIRLKQDRPRQYEVFQLKFFAGLTNKQIAESLDVSVDTVKRDWNSARARIGACVHNSSSS